MGRAHDFLHIPIIDVSNLDAGGSSRRDVAEQLGAACRETGWSFTQACADLGVKVEVHPTRWDDPGRSRGGHPREQARRPP
jgi:hypothetical protein